MYKSALRTTTKVLFISNTELLLHVEIKSINLYHTNYWGTISHLATPIYFIPFLTIER